MSVDEKEINLLSYESARAQIDFLSQSGVPYKLKISNYTTEIVSDIFNTRYVQSMRGKTMFAAFSKIKSDVSKHEVPIINKEELKYFSHNFKKDFFAAEVFNIDLRSAYATILFNDGYLREETYKYIQKISKSDRLASVGMLAARKNIFCYDETGKLYNYEKQFSKTENFFFYCVKRTDEIMEELKFIAYENYLFTWVDGIYFTCNDYSMGDMSSYLDQIKFPFSFETLKNFDVRIKENKVKLKFEKFSASKNKWELKRFEIPAINSQFATDLINYLNVES